MTTMVALLRGVNVGGATSLPMADLRASAEACGFEDVATYIQSGNLVFRTSARRTATMAERLEAELQRRTGRSIDVLVRTEAELARLVAGNPYLARGESPAHLHVTFTDQPAAPGLRSLDLDAFAPEHATPYGRHLYLFLPAGIGRSALAAELSRRAAVGRATTRNWRTVTTLLAVAGERRR